MDHRERWGDPEEALRMAMGGHQAQMWTALPGLVVSFDASSMTAVIQPAIGGVQTDQSGERQATTLPLLADVPVVFPRGGGCTLTFPVTAGDECLVVFSSRPIDSWWQSGGVQRPADARMHSLADGFALVGPMSKAKAISAVSTSKVQLRTDDGLAVIEIDPASHAMAFTAPGGMTINAPTLVINAALSQGAAMGGGSSASSLIGPLTVTNDVTAAGKSVSTHHHTEHDGPSTSGPI
ncbi:MAG: hypothetical protein KGL90_15405 [Burkholderiales bacterium]|nr:hypothetical protein [Burkholderiales bacterium]